MRKKFCIILPLLWLTGCVTGAVPRHVEEIVYEQGKLQRYSYYNASAAPQGDSTAFREAIGIIREADPAAMPDLKELGLSPRGTVTAQRQIRSYTGIIKNQTNYELTIPSANSQGALLVPPRGWIEYTVWNPNVNFSPYLDGKPYRCFNIKVKPKAYPFLCKKYDFMAVIEKDQPPPSKKKIKKPRKRKPPKAPKC